jgi:Flp pilus assembly protein TadB
VSDTAGDFIVMLLTIFTPPGLWITIAVVTVAVLIAIVLDIRHDRRRSEADAVVDRWKMQGPAE